MSCKIKYAEAEEDQNGQAEGGQNRADNFSTIETGLTERSAHTDEKEAQARSEEQEIHPREIVRERKF